MIGTEGSAIVCHRLVHQPLTHQQDPEFGKNLITTPEAMRVSDLGDHGVDICIRGDTEPGEQWGLTGELRKRIKGKFDQEGIEIPWPHSKIYFGEA
jgi:small conductance mechanosensitive channel